MARVTNTNSQNTSSHEPSAQPELLDLKLWDNSTSTIRLFAPASLSSTTETITAITTPEPATNASQSSGVDSELPLVVIWPGWGVGASYYDPIARELASRGFPVVTGEFHGQGSSTARATKTHSFGYHQMASYDYPQTIRAAKEHFGLAVDHPTFFLCHSMGGQVASLFAARPEAKELGLVGVMGVGTGSPHWRGFQGTYRLRLRYGTYWMWLMVKIFGYQPEGRLDFAGYGRQPKDHFMEWHRFVHTNRLHNLRDQDMDYESEKLQVKIPFLLTRYVDDADCTIASCDNLAVSLPPEVVQVEELPKKLGHNSWAREANDAANRFEEFVHAVDAGH